MKYLVLLLVLFEVLLVMRISSQQIYYVKSNSSFSLNCPSLPCFTLDQYTQQADMYFTAASTFVFLAGNHSLRTVVNLTNITGVLLRGEGNDSGVNIIYRQKATIRCDSVTNLTIEGITFILSTRRISEDESIALTFFNSNQISIISSNFQGTGDLNKPLLTAMSLHY